MRRPRLPHRLGMGRVPGVRDGVRHRAAGRAGGRLPPATADLHARDQGAAGEHDENVDFATIVELHGAELAEQLRALTLAIYARAEGIARGRGIILADTKFEFGRRSDGTVVLADEVLTPDSSRFWDAALWQPGTALPSFDKQFVRDWLTRESGWDKASDAPAPPLPAEVIAATRAKYVEAYEKLTGRTFTA
ncbi:MAG: phosphoribosylaminoimidazolesuccinocarboxamide synthase [Micropruina sp.]